MACKLYGEVSSCTSPHGLISPPVVVGKININSTFTLMCGNKKSTCNDFKEILIFAQFRKQKQKAESVDTVAVITGNYTS